MHEDHRQDRFAGRYAVLKCLGAGGMGQVLEVYDTVVGRKVALKVMRDEIRRRESLARRFQREYRAMARLRHRGVPRVHDAGVDDAGRAYFTMDLVHGQPLTTALADQVDPPRLLALAAEVARILIEVHATGIIHRDVKPSNVLLDAEGRIHLIDFGTAHTTESGEDFAEHTTSAPLRTEPGTWLGTPGYVDPSMLEGFPCSARSDIYSLAATIAWMFMRTQPSPDHHAPIPRTGIAAVDFLLQRGMAQDPDNRPASAKEFLAEILAAMVSLSPTEELQDPSAVSTPPPRKVAPGFVLALGMFGGVLGGPVAGLLLDDGWPNLRSGDSREAQPIAVQRADARGETSSAGTRDEDAPPHAQPEHPQIRPDPQRPSSVTGTRRAGRSERAIRSMATVDNWDRVLALHRPELDECLDELKVQTRMARVSLVVDGKAGRFRNIQPVRLPRHVRRCLRDALTDLEFRRFSAKFELTLGISKSPDETRRAI